MELFPEDDRASFGEAIRRELALLSPEDRELLLTSRNGQKSAAELAKRAGITKRSVLYRRDRLVSAIMARAKD